MKVTGYLQYPCYTLPTDSFSKIHHLSGVARKFTLKYYLAAKKLIIGVFSTPLYDGFVR